MATANTTEKATTAKSRDFRRLVAFPVRLLVAFDGAGAERHARVDERTQQTCCGRSGPAWRVRPDLVEVCGQAVENVDNAATRLRDFEHGVVVVADYLSDEAEGSKLLDSAVESGVRRSAEYTEGLAGVRLSSTECKHPHAVPVGEEPAEPV